MLYYYYYHYYVNGRYLPTGRTLPAFRGQAAFARLTSQLSFAHASAHAPVPGRFLVRRSFARLPARSDALVDGSGNEGAERLVWRAFDRDDDVLVVACLADDLVHRHVVRVRGT